MVRLKGGDPFVFGRGGEEAEALRRAGLEVEVVPGVSSAFAAPAAAGIPVTHRTVSTSVTVVTGHDGDPSLPGVDWDVLARLEGTLVVLMGMAARAAIVERLPAAGRRPDHPGGRRPLGDDRAPAGGAHRRWPTWPRSTWPPRRSSWSGRWPGSTSPPRSTAAAADA